MNKNVNSPLWNLFVISSELRLGHRQIQGGSKYCLQTNLDFEAKCH